MSLREVVIEELKKDYVLIDKKKMGALEKDLRAACEAMKKHIDVFDECNETKKEKVKPKKSKKPKKRKYVKKEKKILKHWIDKKKLLKTLNLIRKGTGWETDIASELKINVGSLKPYLKEHMNEGRIEKTKPGFYELVKKEKPGVPSNNSNKNQKERVFDAMTESAQTTDEIAEESGVPKQSAACCLSDLIKEGLVKRVCKGEYALKKKNKNIVPPISEDEKELEREFGERP